MSRAGAECSRLSAVNVPPLAGRLDVEVLESGLVVCVVDNPQAPIVSTAMCYRAGARDESEGEGGVAHFLEHMMFKGSPGYGPGEVDRLTQALGGSNNAFTSHDATVYYFRFAAQHWRRALDIEIDRMRELLLLGEHFESERQVILEELALYESEPWDELHRVVMAELYGSHPYGRPVIGTRDDLHRHTAADLAEFHRRHYRPGNATLVVAGQVERDQVLDAARSFEGDLGVRTRGTAPELSPTGELRRVQRRHGETARLLLALPAPPACDPVHARLRLLLQVVAGGRASPLQRLLVEEEQLCSWLSAEITESQGPSTIQLSLEVMPGVACERVEERLLEDLAGAASSISPAEVERGKRLLLADWVFGQERIDQQALRIGLAQTLFDSDFPQRYLGHALDADVDSLTAAADHLHPAGGVIGWSLPA